MSNRARSLALATLAFILAPTVHAADVPESDDQRLEQQRSAFRDAYPEVERGNWQAVLPSEDLLADYVLWPDLRAAWFRARVTTAPRIHVRPGPGPDQS